MAVRLPNWQRGYSLRRAIQRRYAPAIRLSRLVQDEMMSRRGPKGELDGQINCKRGCERARRRQELRAAWLLDITQYLDRFSACDSCGNVPTHRNLTIPDGLKGNTGELRNDSGRPQKTCIGGQEAGRRPEETRAGGEGAQGTTGAEEITTGTEGERQSHHAPANFKGMTSVVPDSSKADL